MYDHVIIGGGIVGLSTAWALLQRDSRPRVIVVEKESACSQHQSGRNSGVIHSGIYYKPGSLKARLAVQGNQAMVQFCRAHEIPHDMCGKLIVAVEPKEEPLLDNLYRRGLENGVPVERLTAKQAEKIEPYVRCRQAVRVLSTGIVDYKAVCAKLVDLIRERGGEVRLNSGVTDIQTNGTHIVETKSGELETRQVINCAGLQCDRVARLGQVKTSARIVPFRGEYFELVPQRRALVKNLIYPVPNPDFPFLGVHFTRLIDGSVHAGPNAVLSFKREGYRRSDFALRDFAEVMLFPGFWKLARKNGREGLHEMYRSFNKGAFVRSLQRLIPEVQPNDLVAAGSGVRAQALRPDGTLVDDFLILRGHNAVHVLNAPSPAATASLEIGKTIAGNVAELSN
jgi:(S)-2-hydroxyglutarate dehydrogenase